MWHRINHLYLPRTGVVTSQRAGDDGYFQAGVPGGTRAAQFVNLGNGTIYDRATGLTWVKQPEIIIPGAVGVHATNQCQAACGNWANNTLYTAADLAKDTADSTYWVCVSTHTSAAAGTFAADRAGAAAGKWRQTVWTASAANLTTPVYVTWANAVDYCLALEYAGFTDWRLPNIFELVSLHNSAAAAAPWVSPLFGNPKPADYYWTSTPRGSTPTVSALNVILGSPLTVSSRTMTVGDACYCWPVRGGRVIAA
jgi:hypothetical protein